MRPEIELSWRRSRMSGLAPANTAVPVDEQAVDRRSALLRAAAPVLTDLTERIGDAPYGVILSDRDSRVVDIQARARPLHREFDGLGAVFGGVFLEETTGTNSIATAHELRSGVAVRGEEHYLDRFKHLSCYGHPIFHPITRRLLGVVDITCRTADDSPLLAALVQRAVRDIEERALADSPRSRRRVFEAFTLATTGHDRAVLALAGDLVLSNSAAADLVAPADHHLLAQLTAGAGPVRLTLQSGSEVSVLARRVGDGADGTVYEFRRIDVPSRAAGTAGTGPVYIGGGPGTGRTTAARTALSAPVTEFDGAAAAADPQAWLRALALADPARPLLVEDIDRLPTDCATRLLGVVDRPAGLVLTGPVASVLEGAAAALAAACERHVDLLPLADRRTEFADLATGMLRRLPGGDRVRLTPSALAALSAQDWPGELHELRSVLSSTLRSRSAGDLTVSDLPERYRVSPQRRDLGPLERAEHDAIVVALHAAGGNKARAAAALGISRTTLYSRLRSLRIG
ncbi:helix-turn-helix domain-containing protein [Tsukamurella pseudospumae]|nr:helix-turn-helix domain-containing protein [Tsukamurella pseudospumae]